MIVRYILANIRRMRRAQGLTQREMAQKLFMDERTYAKIERGVNKSIDIRLLAAVADILQTDVNSLMRDPALAAASSGNNSPAPEEKGADLFYKPQYEALLQEIVALKKEVKALLSYQQKTVKVPSE